MARLSQSAVNAILAQPVRIQRRRTRGWRLPLNARCVTRPGNFGNPYKTATEFERALAQCVKTPGKPHDDEKMNHMQWIADNLWQLRGRDLACFCAEGRMDCHAQILIEYANKEDAV